MRSPSIKKAQSGASLIIVMLVLLVVSIIGVSAARISLLSERGARNDRDYQMAWQAAEAGLLDAEFDIRGPGTSTRKNIFATNNQIDFVAGCGSRTSGNSKGLCLPAVSGKPVWLTVDFLASNSPTADYGDFTSRAFDAGSLGVKPSRRPRYMIEVLPDTESFGNKGSKAKKKVVYRVTAMGFGPRDDVQALVQMVMRKE